MPKNAPPNTRFIGFYLKNNVSDKLEFLRKELGQSISSLMREGLNMLFERYASALREMDK